MLNLSATNIRLENEVATLKDKLEKETLGNEQILWSQKEDAKKELEDTVRKYEILLFQQNRELETLKELYDDNVLHLKDTIEQQRSEIKEYQVIFDNTMKVKNSGVVSKQSPKKKGVTFGYNEVCDYGEIDNVQEFQLSTPPPLSSSHLSVEIPSPPKQHSSDRPRHPLHQALSSPPSRNNPIGLRGKRTRITGCSSTIEAAKLPFDRIVSLELLANQRAKSPTICHGDMHSLAPSPIQKRFIDSLSPESKISYAASLPGPISYSCPTSASVTRMCDTQEFSESLKNTNSHTVLHGCSGTLVWKYR